MRGTGLAGRLILLATGLAMSWAGVQAERVGAEQKKPATDKPE